MNELINIENIEGVRCFLDKDHVVQLNLEDVSRGLGFTQKKGGVEYVRWDRVEGYLESFEFSPLVGKDDFVPEPIFYLLAMKADNEIARAFQHTIAYEVLPKIRRYGMYAIDQLLDDPDLAIRAFTALKAEREKNRELERVNKEQRAKLDEQKPLVEFSETVIKSCDNILVRDMAKLLCDEGVNIGENRLYKTLRNKGILMDDNTPYQSYIDRDYFYIKEGAYNTPYGTTGLTKTTLVTPRGQIWLVNKMKEWKTGAK